MDTGSEGSFVRNLVKFWVPAGLLDVYRRRRSRTSDLTTESNREASFSLEYRSLEALFPGILTCLVQVPASEVQRPASMVLPLVELLTVAAICAYARPSLVFEIGTYSGSTSLLLALNTPETTRIHTLDLQPSLEGVNPQAGDDALATGWCFAGTPAAGRITQLFGNSRQFDFGPYRGAMDLVFIDANHTYEFVKADTEHAFGLLRRGGILIWDDYGWEPSHAECAGVTRYLNELAGTVPVWQIAGTRLAIHVDRRGPEPA